MRIDIDNAQTRLELRVLELEDTVAMMATILGTMSEMLGALNGIVTHYADAFTERVTELPTQARDALPFWSQNDCTGGCSCAKPEDTPDT